MKNNTPYDLAIIGGGGAGIVAGTVAGGFGARVVLVEKHRLGGECLWTGCVPSKALLNAAQRVSQGASLNALEYVRERRRVVEVQDDDAGLLRDSGVEVRYGAGKFLDRHSFQMEDGILRARHFLIATGSGPRLPDIAGLQEVGFLTNLDVFEQPEPPASLIVIGGGPIGVELGQAFQRLGTQVTLLQRRERLLPRDDVELTTELTALLRDEGMDIYCNAQPRQATREQGLKRVTYEHEGRENSAVAEEILLATGREPHVAGLNLQALGVRVDPQGIVTDATLRTDVANIWACGDVRGQARFAHMAEYEAKSVVQNILLPGRRRVRMDLIPWATFTDPELAHVGLTEEQARARGLEVEVFRHRFDEDDRALVDNVGRGMVKLVAKRPGGRLLGAQILGPRAGELIQEPIMVLRRGGNLREIADAIHVYPTLTVAVQRAAQRWYGARAAAPWAKSLTARYLAWWRRWQR